MAAANTDKLRKGARRWSTTLSGSIDSSVVTIPLTTVTGLPTDTAVTVSIDRVDSEGVLTLSKEEVVTGVVSGTSLINALRGEEGTAQSHASNAVVEVRLTADQWDDMVDHGLVEHNQDGTHTTAVMEALNPVGTIREFTVSTNPGTLLGFGTWSLYGVGRTTVCIDAGDTDFDTVDEEYGSKTHTLATGELPVHAHTIAHTHAVDPPTTNSGNVSTGHTHEYTKYTALTTNTSGGSTSTWNGTGNQNTGGISVNHYHSTNIASFTSGGSSAANSGNAGSGTAHNIVQPSIVVYRWERTA